MKLTFAVVMSATLTVLGGCAAAQPASPSPDPTQVSPPSSRLNIPTVPQPLDASALTADPCGLLSEANRAELGLPTDAQDNTAGRIACDLHSGAPGSKPLEYVRIQVMSDRGLTGIYAQCGTSASARCDTWTLDSLAGYPLIRANGETERRFGSCKQFLGISDRATILINEVKTGRSTAPDCGRADRVATMVVENLNR